VTRKNRLPVEQPPFPRLGETTVPRQRSGNVSETVRAVVEEVRAERAGSPEPEVLQELLDRLREALPGITFDRDSLREHARTISRARPGI
jgi:Arc/MetJ-type ribon-helix-helix transcriptional regulator